MLTEDVGTGAWRWTSLGDGGVGPAAAATCGGGIGSATEKARRSERTSSRRIMAKKDETKGRDVE
jgi:hypothetical protein